MDKRVNVFLKREKKWRDEMNSLRNIIMEFDLSEDFKWMHPCYTLNDKNIVLIHGFKEYCALLFHKGALLNDPDKILIQQTKNTQAARQFRFRDLSQIESQRGLIKKFIKEAIENEKKGRELPLKKTADYDIPDELISVFEKEPEFKSAFKSLTPGRQRSYLLHFGNAKQSKTRISRIEKAKTKIFEGKGYNER